jgi:hypothetical protein
VRNSSLCSSLQSDIFKGKFSAKRPERKLFFAEQKFAARVVRWCCSRCKKNTYAHERKSCCEFVRMINKSFISPNSQTRCAFSCTRAHAEFGSDASEINSGAKYFLCTINCERWHFASPGENFYFRFGIVAISKSNSSVCVARGIRNFTV